MRPRNWRNRRDALAHRARKRFGQNFLTDSTVVGRIVDAIDPQPDDLVVEIGPGQAALTQPLADSGAELVVELPGGDAGDPGRLKSKGVICPIKI